MLDLSAHQGIFTPHSYKLIRLDRNTSLLRERVCDSLLSFVAVIFGWLFCVAMRT